MYKRLAIVTTFACLTSMHASAQSTTAPTTMPGHAAHSGNPIVPGYFADASLVQFDGAFYLYATLDPWGGDTLGCWRSTDFKDWTYVALNWPTKQACTSPTSGGAHVWAPSVVRARDGKFYMAVSVGSEVWAGVADAPAGPWRNLLGDKPLIPGDFRPGYHMIDAEWFIDPDEGAAYLYWGSGWNWVNGKCWAVKVKPDMQTFDGDVRDVTPANYFEGPFMSKHAGKYYLSYSAGNTTEDTYRVHYAIGATPFGPFTEGPNSPILKTDKAQNIVSPGHHAIFETGSQAYILYHRHDIPKTPKLTLRQLCVDVLNYDANGAIETIVPTHEGPPLVRGRPRTFTDVTATASSQRDDATSPANVLDDNYATRWAAAPEARGGWLQLDLGLPRTITSQALRFEYAWRPQRFMVESSTDGEAWTTVVDHTTTPISGSPIVVDAPLMTRYLRLSFPPDVSGADQSLFEWVLK